MNITSIIKEIEAYSRKSGLAPSTICMRAIKDSRFYDRLKRKEANIKNKHQVLKAFMRDNPPKRKSKAV